MAGIIHTDEEHAEALAALDCLLDLDPQLLAGREALPQVDGCREGGQLGLETRDVVELDDALTVGGVGELEAQDLGVVLGLLKALARGLDSGLASTTAMAMSGV
jgi:hypothetical protein